MVKLEPINVIQTDASPFRIGDRSTEMKTREDYPRLNADRHLRRSPWASSDGIYHDVCWTSPSYKLTLNEIMSERRRLPLVSGSKLRMLIDGSIHCLS